MNTTYHTADNNLNSAILYGPLGKPRDRAPIAILNVKIFKFSLWLTCAWFSGRPGERAVPENFLGPLCLSRNDVAPYPGACARRGVGDAR